MLFLNGSAAHAATHVGASRRSAGRQSATDNPAYANARRRIPRLRLAVLRHGGCRCRQSVRSTQGGRSVHAYCS